MSTNPAVAYSNCRRTLKHHGSRLPARNSCVHRSASCLRSWGASQARPVTDSAVRRIALEVAADWLHNLVHELLEDFPPRAVEPGTWASQRSPQERSRNIEFTDTKSSTKRHETWYITMPRALANSISWSKTRCLRLRTSCSRCLEIRQRKRWTAKYRSHCRLRLSPCSAYVTETKLAVLSEGLQARYWALTVRSSHAERCLHGGVRRGSDGLFCS